MRLQAQSTEAGSIFPTASNTPSPKWAAVGQKRPDQSHMNWPTLMANSANCIFVRTASSADVRRRRRSWLAPQTGPRHRALGAGHDHAARMDLFDRPRDEDDYATGD